MLPYHGTSSHLHSHARRSSRHLCDPSAAKPYSSLTSLATKAKSNLQACKARTKDLWAYPGSRVQEFNLETFRFMHKLSYGHRNRRTFVVVLYDPSLPACKSVEYEIERLASGLSHEPSVAVARLNVTPQSNKLSEASQFVGGVLGVQQLPTLLLYPEASPGVMRYQGKQVTAEAILDSLNRCYERVLPHRPHMVLLGVPGPEDALPQQGSSGLPQTDAPPPTNSAIPDTLAATCGATAAGSSAGSGDGGSGGVGSVMLLPPDGTIAGTEGGSSSSSRQGQTGGVRVSGSSSGTEAGQAGRAGGRNAERPGRRAEVGSWAVQSSTEPWRAAQSTYWSGGKVLVWTGMLLLSVGAYAWERWWGPRAELRGLRERQEARAAGRGHEFDEDTNLDDLWRLKALQSTPGGAAILEKYVGVTPTQGALPRAPANEGAEHSKLQSKEG